MPDPDSRPSLAVTIALLVIGLLILIPSGLCTGFFTLYPIVQAIIDRSSVSNDIFGLALAIGGPFILVGGFMVWRGVKRLRR
jgi:H+/gluconate symporter-like permease